MAVSYWDIIHYLRDSSADAYKSLLDDESYINTFERLVEQLGKKNPMCNAILGVSLMPRC